MHIPISVKLLLGSMMKTIKKKMQSTNRDLVSVSLVIVYAQVVTAAPDTYMISILCS